ncbi:TPA: DUF4365 domain-containing protein [Stenotrophomonas maltophilia]
MRSNRVKERIGINKVSRTVEELWESGWQEYGAQNDDAIDGVIIMRRGTKRPSDTGGIVFVQVKCGGDGYRQDQAQYPAHICITLGADYITTHMPRWLRAPGPCVLIFVDDTTDQHSPESWWVNLKKDCISPTNKGNILIPKTQRFGEHSKGDFHKLCGTGTVDRLLTQINLERSESFIPSLGRNESIRRDARKFYRDWQQDQASQLNPTLGPILVNRVGWKHITRQGRLPERIIQSWMLLGAARAMIIRCTQIYTLGHASEKKYDDGNIMITDYLGLRAKVTFTYRHQSICQVVLKRTRLICPNDKTSERQKIWFYSIYEMRRGRENV